MPAVDLATVAALLDDNVDHAPTAVGVITTMVKSYTRGRGSSATCRTSPTLRP